MLQFAPALDEGESLWLVPIPALGVLVASNAVEINVDGLYRVAEERWDNGLHARPFEDDVRILESDVDALLSGEVLHAFDMNLLAGG